MARAIALIRTQLNPLPLAEIARIGVVTSCALALLLAGTPLPL